MRAPHCYVYTYIVPVLDYIFFLPEFSSSGLCLAVLKFSILV